MGSQFTIDAQDPRLDRHRSRSCEPVAFDWQKEATKSLAGGHEVFPECPFSPFRPGCRGRFRTPNLGRTKRVGSGTTYSRIFPDKYERFPGPLPPRLRGLSVFRARFPNLLRQSVHSAEAPTTATAGEQISESPSSAYALSEKNILRKFLGSVLVLCRQSRKQPSNRLQPYPRQPHIPSFAHTAGIAIAGYWREACDACCGGLHGAYWRGDQGLPHVMCFTSLFFVSNPRVSDLYMTRFQLLTNTGRHCNTARFKLDVLLSICGRS